MKIKNTNRGFGRIDFVDRNGVACSLTESSLATESAIRLGCNNSDPHVLIPGQGWQPVDMPAGYVANTRMHLTREMVAALLPHLQKFAEEGEIG